MMESELLGGEVSPRELLGRIIEASQTPPFLLKQENGLGDNWRSKIEAALNDFGETYKGLIKEDDMVKVRWAWSEPIFLDLEGVRKLGMWEELGLLQQLEEIGSPDPDPKDEKIKKAAFSLIKEVSHIRWMFGTAEDQKMPNFAAKPYTPREGWMKRARDKKIDGVSSSDPDFILIYVEEFARYSEDEAFIDIVVWEEAAHLISHLEEFGIVSWWLEEGLAKGLTKPLWGKAGRGLEKLIEVQRRFSSKVDKHLGYLKDLPLKAFLGALEPDSYEARVLKDHVRDAERRLRDIQQEVVLL